jgi:phosphoglycerate kinase
MKTIRDADIKNKRVLMRCDFNCPIDDKGNILDDFRIKRTVLTIEYLIQNNAKIILMSHLDDPKGKVVEKLRLNPIQDKLFEYLDLSILKAPDCVGQKIKKMVNEMQRGEIMLLENLRFHKEEEENNDYFAKDLSSLGNIFANDAFGASHREHASIVGVPKYLPAFAGLLLEKEVETLKNILERPKRPLIGIFGGVKIETKLPTIKKFLEIADYILVGGKIAKEIDFSDPKLFVAELTEDGFDINNKSIKGFKEIIKKANTIVWNGPLGYFEKEEFEKGTKEIAMAVSESPSFKVIGGGESLFVVSKYNLQEKIDFLSTGGGAMLEFLANEKLPGLEVIPD